jgi:hypothetical protein
VQTEHDDSDQPNDRCAHAVLNIQAPSHCRDGHFTDPYEQKTQRSPGLGWRTVPHPAHSSKCTQALVVITARILQASGSVSPGTVWVRSEGCDSGAFRGLRADLPHAK